MVFCVPLMLLNIFLAWGYFFIIIRYNIERVLREWRDLYELLSEPKKILS